MDINIFRTEIFGGMLSSSQLMLTLNVTFFYYENWKKRLNTWILKSQNEIIKFTKNTNTTQTNKQKLALWKTA